MPMNQTKRMRVNKVDRLDFPTRDARFQLRIRMLNRITIHFGKKQLVGRRTGRGQFKGQYFDGDGHFVLNYEARGARNWMTCDVFTGRGGRGDTHAGSWTADEDGGG